jgi:DNA-binding response OmpR family regulator
MTSDTAFVSEKVTSIKILIVEDENLIAEDLKRTLQTWGFRVMDTVATGLEAIEAARDERPDLVLMDVRLKGNMNGVQTAINIQNLYRPTVPVIFTSAVPMHLSKLIRAVDPCLYLAKPFTEQELRSCVRGKLKLSF